MRGVVKGPVKGLYYVSIVYPIITALAIILGAALLVYVSYKYPYEGNVTWDEKHVETVLVQENKIHEEDTAEQTR